MSSIKISSPGLAEAQATNPSSRLSQTNEACPFTTFPQTSQLDSDSADSVNCNQVQGCGSTVEKLQENTSTQTIISSQRQLSTTGPTMSQTVENQLLQHSSLPLDGEWYSTPYSNYGFVNSASLPTLGYPTPNTFLQPPQLMMVQPMMQGLVMPLESQGGIGSLPGFGGTSLPWGVAGLGMLPNGLVCSLSSSWGPSAIDHVVSGSQPGTSSSVSFDLPQQQQQAVQMNQELPQQHHLAQQQQHQSTLSQSQQPQAKPDSTNSFGLQQKVGSEVLLVPASIAKAETISSTFTTPISTSDRRNSTQNLNDSPSNASNLSTYTVITMTGNAVRENEQAGEWREHSNVESNQQQQRDYENHFDNCSSQPHYHSNYPHQSQDYGYQHQQQYQSKNQQAQLLRPRNVSFSLSVPTNRSNQSQLSRHQNQPQHYHHQHSHPQRQLADQSSHSHFSATDYNQAYAHKSVQQHDSLKVSNQSGLNEPHFLPHHLSNQSSNSSGSFGLHDGQFLPNSFSHHHNRSYWHKTERSELHQGHHDLYSDEKNNSWEDEPFTPPHAQLLRPCPRGVNCPRKYSGCQYKYHTLCKDNGACVYPYCTFVHSEERKGIGICPRDGKCVYANCRYRHPNGVMPLKMQECPYGRSCTLVGTFCKYALHNNPPSMSNQDFNGPKLLQKRSFSNMSSIGCISNASGANAGAIEMDNMAQFGKMGSNNKSFSSHTNPTNPHSNPPLQPPSFSAISSCSQRQASLASVIGALGTAPDSNQKRYEEHKDEHASSHSIPSLSHLKSFQAHNPNISSSNHTLPPDLTVCNEKTASPVQVEPTATQQAQPVQTSSLASVEPLNQQCPPPAQIDAPCPYGSKCKFIATCKYSDHSLCTLDGRCTDRQCHKKHNRGQAFVALSCSNGTACNYKTTTCRFLYHPETR